jgi:hypothetical protein
MSNKTSLTNFMTICTRGLSRFQPDSSLVLIAVVFLVVGQSLLFSQPIGAPMPVPACDHCCAQKPSYTGIPGQIAVATQFASGEGPLGNQDVVIWNISPTPYPPANTDWATLGLGGDKYYSDPRWNRTNLGDVFGLTLDSAGNSYVSATTIYGPGNIGNLAPIHFVFDPNRGQIYKIANGTGNPTLFAQLDNPHGAGLGNISYDCEHAGFYVSDFDDGLIYHLDTSGKTLNTWDHGANLSSATDLNNVPLTRPNIPPYSATCHVLADGSPCGYDSLGYAKLGRRPWAVHVYQDRLYYSIWNMDYSQGSAPNEIWSIALDPGGNFILPARLEITMPLLSGSTKNNPVSDLTFGPKGTMIVAERTMAGDHVPVGSGIAHQSRVIEFGWTGSSWASANLSSYAVGCAFNKTNSAGGVDFDLTPGAKFHVWATGDALHLVSTCSTSSDDVYGLQGFLPGGGDVTNSILIDLNDYILKANKMQLGDVKIPCPQLQYPTLTM